MHAEVIWLRWQAAGWNVPFPVAVLLAGWLASDSCDDVLGVDSWGEVNNRARNPVTLYNKEGWINDYAPLLIALWLLNHGKNASPKWYTRFPYVEQAVTDLETMRWAQEVKA